MISFDSIYFFLIIKGLLEPNNGSKWKNILQIAITRSRKIVLNRDFQLLNRKLLSLKFLIYR